MKCQEGCSRRGWPAADEGGHRQAATIEASSTGIRVSARNGAKKCAPIRIRNTIAVVRIVSSSAVDSVRHVRPPAPRRIEEGEERADGGGLGDREYAADRCRRCTRRRHEQQQRPHCAARLKRSRSSVLAGRAGISAATWRRGRPSGRRATVRSRPGRKPARNRTPDRLLGQEAVDHQHGGGRDEDAERAAGRDGAGRQAIVVFVAPHLGQRDPAMVAAVASEEPDSAAKPAAGEDGRGREPAAPMADPAIGRAVEIGPIPDTAANAAHEDEKRYDAEREHRGVENGNDPRHVQRGAAN